MILFHSDKYINYLKKVAPNLVENTNQNITGLGAPSSKKDYEKFNVGENDCPCFPGLFEFS